MTNAKSEHRQSKITGQSIAILGCGKMGSLIASSLLRDNCFPPERLRVSVRHEERATTLSAELGLQAFTNNCVAVTDADIVFVCVKPQHVSELLVEIRPNLLPKAIVVSIATAVTTGSIEDYLMDGAPVIRAMPNTACRVGHGMTALCRGRHASKADLARVEMLFAKMGKATEVDENLMDGVTALSASGPAFVYIVLEALAEGGVQVGLPRSLSTLLAAQATLGAATMVLTTGEHPAVLKSEVTTPAGCTVDGILALEDGKIRASLIRAISAAAAKASRLFPPRT